MEDWLADGVEVTLETGCMTWWAVDVLREAGIEPVVVNARQFKMITDSGSGNLSGTRDCGRV